MLAGMIAAVLVQGSAPPPDWTPRGAFTAISAADARGLGRWYADMLGFQEVQAGEVAERKIVFVLFRKGDNLIEMVQLPDSAPAPAAAGGEREAWRARGYFKSGFWVDDLDGLEARLRTKNATFMHGIVRPQGQPWRTFAVRDPEGNIVQFFGVVK